MIRLGAPMGSMTLDRRSTRDIVCVAGGTGLAPIKALIEELTRVQPDPLGARLLRRQDRDDLYDLAALNRLAARYPWLSVVAACSDDPEFAGEQGNISDVVARYGPWNEHDFFVSGSPPMVKFDPADPRRAAGPGNPHQVRRLRGLVIREGRRSCGRAPTALQFRRDRQTDRAVDRPRAVRIEVLLLLGVSLGSVRDPGRSSRSSTGSPTSSRCRSRPPRSTRRSRRTGRGSTWHISWSTSALGFVAPLLAVYLLRRDHENLAPRRAPGLRPGLRHRPRRPDRPAGPRRWSGPREQLGISAQIVPEALRHALVVGAGADPRRAAERRPRRDRHDRLPADPPARPELAARGRPS